MVVELEHLKTKTRLKDEKFTSVKGECETDAIGDPSMWIKTKYIWGVGVMKDYNLTLRNLHDSHTLSCYPQFG